MKKLRYSWSNRSLTILKPKTFKVVNSKEKIYSNIVPVYDYYQTKIDTILIHYTNNFEQDDVFMYYMLKNYSLKANQYEIEEDTFIRDKQEFKIISKITLNGGYIKNYYFKLKRKMKLKNICEV